MDDIELKNMWKAYDQKIEEAKILNLQTREINNKTFQYLQTHKAQSILKSLSTFKKWAVAIGILWVLLLGTLVYATHFKNLYFSISVIIILFFIIISIVAYKRHIVLINQIDYSESILDTQNKLTELQASTIKIVRFLWLQMPFYTTFYWNTKWINSDIKFWLIAFPITLFFTFLAIWLFKNISLKNADKKWFKVLLGGLEWTYIIYAKKYLEEIEEFKKE